MERTPSEPSLLPNQWVKCLCVAKFDLELGQVMEACYPDDALHAVEKKDITSLAFPESNSISGEATHRYTFRLRHCKRFALDPSDSKLPLSAVAATEHSFSYGFTVFSQKKDPQNPRGFSQRSIVVITDLYFFSLFYQIAEILSSRLFADEGSPAQTAEVLQAFYEATAAWPAPVPGQQIEL